MRNIVLFGGAFDPIHLGHINMAKCVSDALDAEVIFIPAKISIWKSESAPVEDKIKMIELSIKDSGFENRFSISRVEADSKEDQTYSIDTVKYFKDKYPEDKLYLLIGQDQVNSFHKWKDASLISKLAQIVFFERLNEQSLNENVKEYNMIGINGEINDISSSDIRELKSLEVSDSVINYIIDNDLYFMKKIKGMMNERRYAHSKSVAKLSYEIAKSNHLNEPKKTLIAGLIHDCGKDLPKDEEKEIMVEHYKEYLEFPRIIYHQFTGEYLANKVFGINDNDILTSIKYHTTGNSNIGDIGLIVYAADKIEPTRGFDSRDLIDAMKQDLYTGFDKVMKANIEYFNEKEIEYKNPLTLACIKQYCK